MNSPSSDLGAKEAFIQAGYKYLNEISGGVVCGDRTCIRCRIADILAEVEAALED